MLWDKVFWLWFLLTSALALYLLLEETTLWGVLQAMLLIGLALVKLAEETSRDKPGVSSKILKVLGKK